MSTKREIRKAQAIGRKLTTIAARETRSLEDLGHTYISKDKDNSRGIHWFPGTPMFDTHEKRVAYKAERDFFPNFGEVMMYIGRYHRDRYAKEAEDYIFYNDPKNRGAVVAIQVGII